MGIDTKTKKAKLLPIKELSSIEPSDEINIEAISKDITDIEDEEYKEAQKRNRLDSLKTVQAPRNYKKSVKPHKLVINKAG